MIKFYYIIPLVIITYCVTYWYIFGVHLKWNPQLSACPQCNCPVMRNTTVNNTVTIITVNVTANCTDSADSTSTWLLNPTPLQQCLYYQTTCTDSCFKLVADTYAKQLKSYAVINTNWLRTTCRPTPRKLYIGFLFNGEWDLLEIQVENARQLAEKVIIIESNVTFSGAPKPLYWHTEANRRFSLDLISMVEEQKIFYSEKDFEIRRQDIWHFEHSARASLSTKMKELRVDPSDLVYYGDIDQVMRPECMWIMKWATVIPQLPIHIGLQMFVHSFYWRFVGDWPGTTVLTSVDHLNQIARNNRLEIGEKLQLSNSGWHLTWFLQPSDWVKKMDGYSHFDWSKPHFKELSWIEYCKATGADPYQRKFDNGPSPNPTMDDLPFFILANKNRFSYMIWPPGK